MKDRKIIIAVSGSAEISACGEEAVEKAFELGRQIALQNCNIATGATTGFPYYSAQGAHDNGAFSLGLSPASTKAEHVDSYRLLTDHMDVIVYTGFGYPGRDLMLVKSSDAIIIGCGRIGTIHEFTVAFESDMPIGILEGPWATDEVIKNIYENSHRQNEGVTIIFESDPAILVQKIIQAVKEKNKRYDKK